jgi:hypothetical protein
MAQNAEHLYYYYPIKILQTSSVKNSLPSFHTTRVAYKTTPPTLLRCRGNVFTEPVPNNDKRIHRSRVTLRRAVYRQSHKLSFDTTRTVQKTTPPTILLLSVFVAAGTCLRSRFLAFIGGINIHSHRLIRVIYRVHRWWAQMPQYTYQTSEKMVDAFKS